MNTVQQATAGTPTPAQPATATHGVVPAFVWACRRDLSLLMHSRAELALIVIFFVLVTSLFPLSVNPDPVLLHTIAPGIAWVSALLSVLLALPRWTSPPR